MAAGKRGGMKWYAVMTAPRGEELANRNLKRAGYWTFYPHERVRRRRKRANVDQYVVEWINEPYFPRYLFVAIREGQGFMPVNEAEGVSTIVYSGEIPLEIPEPVMDELFALGDDQGRVGTKDRTQRHLWPSGSHVRLRGNSPMSGLIAQIALDKGKEICLWVDILGARRQISVAPEVVAEIAHE